ncbi:MAG: serine/threonine protein kinase [Verrucomicrobia bacterium]|nr:serine/threonine protein kinase [Verrucomicrobiota bacterium]
MNTVRICQSCKKPLPADAPEGLCPECLVKVALGSGVSPSGTPSSAPTNFSPAASAASAETPSLDDVAKLFPQLEILELLGRGGMGVVYKARQKQLDRLIALKIMLPQFSRDPAFVERFNREARALAKLNHPNIVAVYDFGQTGDAAAPLCYFIMEFVDGANLRSVIQSGKLTSAEALAIVPRLCDALQFAHDEGVVHRDIKPANILVDRRGRVKIADFGLAKLAGATDVSLTRSQQGMGTPQYMAPEQLSDAKSVDHRADIYSLGVVFYEMLTGELPMGRFALPSEKVQIDVRLDEVVLRSLERNVELRYQHASEVRTDVENISALMANVPLAVRHWLGWEYKSKATCFGLPWIHVCSGVDPATGKRRVAKGIIAIGDTAKGVFAFGGKAFGVVAFGGVAVGGFACGGVGLGLFSLAGLALALVAAYGGVAIAPVALGGLAAGYYAAGGGAFGAHAIGGNANDPDAERFFSSLNTNGEYLTIGGLAFMALAFLVSIAGTAWARRKAAGTEKPTASAAEMKPLDHRVSEALTVGLPGWFNRRAPWAQKLIQAALTIIVGCATLVFLGFNIHSKTDVTAGQQITNKGAIQIGQPSPWFTVDFGGSYQGITIHWLSASLWIGLAGVAAGFLSERLRRSRPGFDEVVDRRKRRRWMVVAIVVAALYVACLVVNVMSMSGATGKAARTVMDRATNSVPPAATKDAKPASAATELLRKVDEKYGALSTFSAAGKNISQVTLASGGTPTTLAHTFSLNLARPEFYRVEWTNVIMPGVTMTGAAWSAGDGHKVLMNGKVSTFLNREMSLATATGLSGGATHTVPSLFFKDEESSLLKSLTNATLLADESVGADLCHVITGDGPAGKYTLWITKKDLFLKQSRTAHAANSGLGTASATDQVSPETMRKLMKTLGQDSSPEGVSKMTKQMADMKQKAGAVQVTITETFEHIAANELMIKEDFEVAVPAASGPAPKKP